MPLLSNYISVHRRYTRSINLERDLEVSDSVLGYVPTVRALETLDRFLNAYDTPRSVRAWTITGVYGTGKSAFAHFLTALCSPKEEQPRDNALSVLSKVGQTNNDLYKRFESLSTKGLLRAVVTAQPEPISTSIIRALYRGASLYWDNARGAKPNVISEIVGLIGKINNGERISNKVVLGAIKKVASASKSGVLLVIDELGKNLEYAAQNQSTEDLYILQQIAELPSDKDEHPVFVFGLLHQSFADYAHNLAAAQRNEWAKIQGRFEDIPFAESPEQVMHLIGQAIDNSNATKLSKSITNYVTDWSKALKDNPVFKGVASKTLGAVYPLHPVTAMVLPILCSRYAQNDRTLFTFLTSAEPHSFSSFLNDFSPDAKKLPTLKIHQLYDYFVEAAGMAITLRPQLQRWVEIQNRISDARHLDPDTTIALKTIGILNLISTAGSLRATRTLVSQALCDNPRNKDELSHWKNVIDLLIDKGFLVYRAQLDELRIWEGSDFNVEQEISEYIQAINQPLAELLNGYTALRPMVAQRHSYKTGTLRYFERFYADRSTDIEELEQKASNSAGLICYWVDAKKNNGHIPEKTKDGKPIILISSNEVKSLRLSCHELVALKNMAASAPQLRADGVARNEVMQRIAISKRLLDEVLQNSFDLSKQDVSCRIAAKEESFNSNAAFNSQLSIICDKAYFKGVTLWNELINRSELTTQGAKARRILIEAMIERTGEERLGIEGYGPERSMFESLLSETGIYKKEGDDFFFTAPFEKNGLYHVFEKVEAFCTSATEKPKSLDALYCELKAQPYGVNVPIVPVLFLAVLLKHNEDMSLYQDGSFLPDIGIENFELLVKNPSRFAVKHFEIKGLKAEVFKDLQKVLTKPGGKVKSHVRNATLLGIVKPLVRIVSKLPQYSLQITEDLSKEAIAVRKALLTAREPDQLLFTELPVALSLEPITSAATNSAFVKIFRQKLVLALQELQQAYEKLLSKSREQLLDAFGVRSEPEKLREDLRVRASYLAGQCVELLLKRFIIAATDSVKDDKEWLEAILMIIVDKPAESWRDGDFDLFGNNLSDLSRRFANLEAIQKDISARKIDGGFEAKRITLTRPDGTEEHKMIWVEHTQLSTVEAQADKILKEAAFTGNKQLSEAIVASLVEKLLGSDKKTEVDNIVTEVKEKKRG